jgi:hypothetical protein
MLATLWNQRNSDHNHDKVFICLMSSKFHFVIPLHKVILKTVSNYFSEKLTGENFFYHTIHIHDVDSNETKFKHIVQQYYEYFYYLYHGFFPKPTILTDDICNKLANSLGIHPQFTNSFKLRINKKTHQITII